MSHPKPPVIDDWIDSKHGTHFRAVDLGGVYRLEVEHEGEWEPINVKLAANDLFRRVVQLRKQSPFGRFMAAVGARRG